MDLIKIGKYIAGKRKALGLTQRQLAEQLGMSDKSVSKWERGICLPDVSVYSDLCGLLGISINEFLAGEDIAQAQIVQKSEENILGVATDSKHRQKRLQAIICVLLAVSLLAVSAIGVFVFRASRPQNFIAPIDKNSAEMETARLFAGPDGAYIYQFTTTDAYNSLTLYYSEYQAGSLMYKEDLEIGFDGMGSPKEGEILLLPDFKNFVIKVVISAEGSKLTTEIPILENVPEREYYGRSATEIREKKNITYNEEQPLAALLYDNDEMRVLDLGELMDGQTDSLAENDFVYFFSCRFRKG